MSREVERLARAARTERLKRGAGDMGLPPYEDMVKAILRVQADPQPEIVAAVAKVSYEAREGNKSGDWESTLRVMGTSHWEVQDELVSARAAIAALSRASLEE